MNRVVVILISLITSGFFFQPHLRYLQVLHLQRHVQKLFL